MSVVSVITPHIQALTTLLPYTTLFRSALLNIGTEAAKGNTLTKKALNLMDEQQEFHFAGNVEAKVLMDDAADVVVTDGYTGNMRSEEHTSELQSRFDLVCRLLLEEKKR